jgi:branched-chain amino acid transport system ATP-binding protein
MLELKDVHAYYGQSHVLQGISLRVQSGEVVGLLGRNGAGKTTTLKSIMGLVTIREGERTLAGQGLSRWPAYRVPYAGISYIPQGQRVFPELSVRENLSLGLLRGRFDEAAWRQVTRAFPVLTERLEQPAGTLSGGEQQMLAIARALLAQPQYLLMDEPTEGLMPSLVAVVEAQIHAMREQGLGMLLAEQNVDTALRVCDRFYILEKGRISAQGLAREASPEQLQKFLGVLL